MSDVLMRVTAVDYTTDGDDPVVKLTGRDEDGNRRVHWVDGTRPYLYVREGQEIPERHAEKILEREDGYASFDGEPLERVVCRVPDDVSDRDDEGIADEDFPTWESDIPYYRRCSIDYDLSGYVRVPDRKRFDMDDVETDVSVPAGETIDHRVVVGDIEVLSDGGDFQTMLEEATATITNVTLYDSYRDRYDAYVLDPDDDVSGEDIKPHLDAEGVDEIDVVVHYCPTEVSLLESMLGYFEDVRPDVTTGWNWVGFDVQYILRRLYNLYDPTANNLNPDRLSDAGGTSRRVSDYHGHLARSVTGVPAIDMMQLFFERIEYSGWRSKALEYVSQKLLGRGKLSDVTVADAYGSDKGKLAAYNIIDVELCVAINDARDIVEFAAQLAELSQVQIYDVFSEMRLVDGFIMSHSDDDEILPPQHKKDVPENAGGLVLEPSSGIKEWVGVVDLKSLYPSSMITWNTSPETVGWQAEEDDWDLAVPWVPEADDVEYPVTEDDVTWDRLCTSLEDEGLIPKYLKLLFANREDMKAERAKYEDGTTEYETWDLKQYAIKVIMNSFYGVSSHDHWRLSVDGLGDAITSASRYALYLGKKLAEDAGYPVIYGDTDSCFISLKRDWDGAKAPDDDDEYRELVVSDGKGLVNTINRGMSEGIRKSGLEGPHPYLDGSLPHDQGSHCLYYEFEKVYRRFIQFGKKKRYAGNVVWKEGEVMDKIDVTGFESERSDTPEIAATVQTKALHMVLSGEGKEAVSDYVSGLVDDVRAGDVDLYEVARPKSIARPRESYVANTQTLRACRNAEDLFGGRWRQGDDPFLVFLSETPPLTPSYEVLALEWGDSLPEGFEIDAEKHIEICFEGPLSPILNEVGWLWSEVKSGVLAGDATESDWGSAPEPDDEDEDDDGGVGGALSRDW